MIGATFNQIVLSNQYTNEYVLWDEVIDPTASGLNLNGSARAALVTVTGVLDPTNSTDPGINQVDTGVAYIINGVSLVGDSDDPTEANVRSGIVYDNASKTGTLAVPTPAQVKNGVATDDTTGTLVSTDPGIANVLLDTAYTIESVAKVGTLELVVNTISGPTVKESSALTAAGDLFNISIGDSLVIAMTAKNEDGTTINLTGAEFETKFRVGSVIASFDNAKHAILDQSSLTGQFTLTINATDTQRLTPGLGKDIVTKITQGSSIIHYRADRILNVFSSDPIN
jgi:hypothetical protein